MTATFSFCQTDYPKLSLINGDTVILFTPLQSQKITATFLELDKQVFLNSSLTKEINLLKQKDSISNEEIDILVKQNLLSDKIFLEKASQFELCDNELSLNLDKVRKYKNHRKYYFLGGFIGGSTFVYLIVNALK